MEDYIIYNESFDDVDTMIELCDRYQNEQMILEGKILDEATGKGNKENILIKIIKFLPRLIRAIATRIRKAISDKVLDIKIKRLRSWTKETDHVQEAFKEKVNISLTLHHLSKFADQFANFVREACTNADELLSMMKDLGKTLTKGAQDFDNYLKGNVYSIHVKLAKHYSKIQKWADELVKDINKTQYYSKSERRDRMGVGHGLGRDDLGIVSFVYSRVEVSKGLDYVDRIRKTLVISCKYMDTTVKLFDDFDYGLFAKNDFQQTYHATQAVGNKGYYSRKTIVEDFTPLLKEVDYLRNDFKVLANSAQKIINYLVDWIKDVYDYSHLGDKKREANIKELKELKKRDEANDDWFQNAQQYHDDVRDYYNSKRLSFWDRKSSHDKNNWDERTAAFRDMTGTSYNDENYENKKAKYDKAKDREKRRYDGYNKIYAKYNELFDKNEADFDERYKTYTRERDNIYNRQNQLLWDDPYDTNRLRYAVEYAEELTFDDIIK